MGMAAPMFYTREMVLTLPSDGNRYETVHGELLVTPSPREIHQRVQIRMISSLDRYLEGHPVGQLYVAPADISWGPDTLVQPDIFVVPLKEARTGDWSLMRKLMLAVEILSPSTARQDRFTKRRLYQEVGIPVSWFVDCNARHIEVWTPGAIFPVFESERVSWLPAGVSEPLVIELSELFRPI